MERLCDMDVYALKVKTGDIKVDSEELKILFECLQNYHSVLCNSLDILAEDERRDLENGIAFTEYMQNKYLVLGELRQNQKQMYDFLQKFKDENFTKSSSAEEVENARRTVWGMYLDYKGQREQLERELALVKEKLLERFS